MRITCRPLSSFPAEFHARPLGDPFSAGWTSTVKLLERELHHLGAESVVIELDVTEAEIRLDGMPYADARPGHPGVVVDFDSKHGPLRYGTDACPHWQSNVRAIALALEALRRVERYGVGRRGEQYVGWRALPAGDADPRRSAERGRELIAEAGTVKAALIKHHPDHGGNPDDLAAIQAARRS